jgi:hypothetical protein
MERALGDKTCQDLCAWEALKKQREALRKNNMGFARDPRSIYSNFPWWKGCNMGSRGLAATKQASKFMSNRNRHDIAILVTPDWPFIMCGDLLRGVIRGIVNP